MNQWHDLGIDRFDLPAVVRGEAFGFEAQLSGVFLHMASPASAPPSDADTNLMLDQVTRAAFCLLRQVSSYTKLYRVMPKMFWYNSGISMVFRGISAKPFFSYIKEIQEIPKLYQT